MTSAPPCPSSRSRKGGLTKSTSTCGRGAYMWSRSLPTSCEEGQLDRVLEVMIQAARGAAEIARKHFRRGVEVTLKAVTSRRQQADRMPISWPLEHPIRIQPEPGFLGEEF